MITSSASYSSAVSWLRRAFLSDFFVTVRLLQDTVNQYSSVSMAEELGRCGLTVQPREDAFGSEKVDPWPPFGIVKRRAADPNGGGPRFRRKFA